MSTIEERCREAWERHSAALPSVDSRCGLFDGGTKIGFAVELANGYRCGIKCDKPADDVDDRVIEDLAVRAVKRISMLIAERGVERP